MNTRFTSIWKLCTLAGDPVYSDGMRYYTLRAFGGKYPVRVYDLDGIAVREGILETAEADTDTPLCWVEGNQTVPYFGDSI